MFMKHIYAEKKKEKFKTQTENEKRKYIASPTFTVLHSIYEIALKSSTNTFLKLKNLTQLDQKTNFHINNPFLCAKGIRHAYNTNNSKGCDWLLVNLYMLGTASFYFFRVLSRATKTRLTKRWLGT